MPAEVGGRTSHRGGSELGETRLYLRLGEAGADLAVERLRGNSGLTLQWISWDQRGTLDVNGASSISMSGPSSFVGIGYREGSEGEMTRSGGSTFESTATAS